LSWGGASGGNMIRCGGTTGSANVCKATFKYFNMVGNSPNGMLINNADGNSTTAGRIMMVQPVVQNAAGNNSLTVNGLNYTTVTDYDGIFQYSTGTGTAITVSNGGGSATGAFNKFGGLSSGNLHFYSVSGGANAEFFAVWHDGNASPECDAGTASGAGNFTYALGQLSIGGSAGCSTVPEITLSNFTGKAYLAGPSIQEIERDSDIAVNLQITGSSGAGSVLAQITATSSTPYTNSGGASLAVLNSAHCATCSTGPVFSLLPESPSSFACPSATCTLITNNMTQLANTGPPPVGQTSLPAGVTDVLMDHIFAGGANLAIDIEH
jgi:hypothetical protein